jgi:serine/threonine protein kinase
MAMGIPVYRRGDKIDFGSNKGYFTIESLLGKGAYSDAYLLRNTQKPYIQHVLKINRDHSELDPEIKKTVVYDITKRWDKDARTEHEVRLLSGLSDIHLVGVQDSIHLEGDYQGILSTPVKNPRLLSDIINDFISQGVYEYLNFNPEQLYGQFNKELADFRRQHPDESPSYVSLDERWFFSSGEDINDSDFLVSRNLGMLADLFNHLCLQVSHIMGYLTKQKISHGDIGPHNLLLDEQLNLILIDFGLAQKQGVPVAEGLDTLMGKTFYRDPRLMVDKKFKENYFSDLSTTKDDWSWALTFYELLTGTNLITHKSIASSSKSEMDDFFQKFFPYQLFKYQSSAEDPYISDESKLRRKICLDFDKVGQSFGLLYKSGSMGSSRLTTKKFFPQYYAHDYIVFCNNYKSVVKEVIDEFLVNLQDVYHFTYPASYSFIELSEFKKGA